MKRALAVAALFFVGLGVGDLHAAPPSASASASAGASPASSTVTVSAAPVFGTDAATGDGWLEIVATVSDSSAAPAKGTLELTSSWSGYYYMGSSSHPTYVAKAPFHVLGHSSVGIRIPMQTTAYTVPTVTVTARGDDGAKLAETTVSLSPNVAPLLVDVDQPSRLSILMRGWPITPSWDPGTTYRGGASSSGLSVGTAAVDPTTGDLELPERAAAYEPVSVLVIRSDKLARVEGAALDAVVGWVLSGGTLAVIPARPEDLRVGILASLVGGAIAQTPAPAIMMTLPGASRAGGATIPSFGAPPTPMPTFPPMGPSGDAGAGATPIGFFVPARSTTVGTAGIGPRPALKARLVGFSGGNLQPSAYGGTAAYGLGQVHVFGFDPAASPAIEDPWTHARLLDMVSDAWDRHALVAFPQGSGVGHASNLYEVHRALDPNENFRPALGIAAILLVLYSILAGPLTFMRAHKRGRPLDPLVWAPIASAVCFALIVFIGLAGKGWSGRARHISLAEAGAGMSRGTVRRFRGFFSSQTRAMRVRSTEAGDVLDVVTTDSHDEDQPALRLDKDGASLENLTSLPWQTVVVSEDGFTDLGGGVCVREKVDGNVEVANRVGKELHNVIVWAPKMNATWFASIPNGTTVLSSSGKIIFTASGRVGASAGTRVVHAIDTPSFSLSLGKVSDDMSKTWGALAAASGSAVDWWPDDVPVVAGEIEGGEGSANDTGLRIESDRLFFRVVGEGGAT
jgi:hypothetical protein